MKLYHVKNYKHINVCLNYDKDAIELLEIEFEVNEEIYHMEFEFRLSFNVIEILFFKNNLIHNIYGPSLIRYNEHGNLQREEYFINDEIHRIDGPAGIFYSKYENNYERWYYKGENYTNEVNQWIKDNNFNSWKSMTEDDYNRMWFEIL